MRLKNSRFKIALVCALTVALFVPPRHSLAAKADAGAGYAGHQPLDTVAVTFLNPSQGWRLAAGWDRVRGLHGPLFVSQTSNGGLTWRTIGSVPNGMRSIGGEAFRVSAIVFGSSRDGWAFGSALYSTHDSGRTWKTVPIQGNRTTLSVTGRSVWRLDARCSNDTCRSALFASTAGSDRWTPIDWRPPAFWTSGASLIRADALHAWLLSGELTTANRVTARLVGTTDGGKTWHALPIPCSTQGPIGDRLAAYDPQNIWAFCASEPGAGEQLKTVDSSTDGGRTWRLVSASGEYLLKNLSVAGYVGSAALTSPTSAWLALGRGTLLHTANGGRTWGVAIPYAEANPGDGGVGPVTFVDLRDGWLLSFPYLLFRTVDGGRHWQKIQLR